MFEQNEEVSHLHPPQEPDKIILDGRGGTWVILFNQARYEA